jgi:hypothetical protein
MIFSVNTYESYDDFLNRLNHTLDQNTHRINAVGTHHHTHHQHRQHNSNHNQYQQQQTDRSLDRSSPHRSPTNNNSNKFEASAINNPPGGYRSYNKNILVSNLNPSPQSLSSTQQQQEKKQQQYQPVVSSSQQPLQHTSNYLAQNYRSSSKDSKLQQQQLVQQQHQDEHLRARLRTAINSIRSNSKASGNSTDVYYDKISDQKFFNRNFKVGVLMNYSSFDFRSFKHVCIKLSQTSNNDI